MGQQLAEKDYEETVSSLTRLLLVQIEEDRKKSILVSSQNAHTIPGSPPSSCPSFTADHALLNFILTVCFHSD